jgi:Xaa-Pro aminopeptidase
MNRTADRHCRTTRDLARLVVFAMMAIAPRQAIVAQRAERLSNWTSPIFPVAEYVARRRAALAMLGADDVLLVPSAEGTSSGDTFRQSDDFEYLVGLEIPRAVLMVNQATRQSWLFVPARDPNFENAGRPNDFPGRMLASDPTLRALSGVDSVLTDDALPAVLAVLASAGRRMVINGGGTGVSGVTSNSMFARQTPGSLLSAHIRQAVPAARITNAFDVMATLRMIKSRREIALLRESARVTSVAIARGAARVRPGADERTLTGAFTADCMALGAQRVAFTPIIKSGDNSLWPWRILGAQYDRRNRAMQRGELMIYDVGCERAHYVSDVGRTFPVSERFTPTQHALVEMVRHVSDAVIAAARPGITLNALQAVAIAAIPAAAKPYMQVPTYFGHHIGLDAGDPSLASAVLAPGMVFTIEPWYYNHVDSVAVFIEDEILITASGSENLTASLPRDAAGLEAMRGRSAPVANDADAGRGLTRDGALSFTIDTATHSVRVYDALNDTIVANTPVCSRPLGGELTADDITYVVRCDGSAHGVSINTASYAVVPPAGRPPANARRIKPAPAGTSFAKTEVIIVGTIHGEHRTSTRYSTDVLRRLLIAMRPDFVLTEIAPNRLDVALSEFRATGRITEPRVVRFPEYVDVLFPLTRTMPFTIVPTAGWSRPMDLFRTTALKRIEADPSRRAEWREYTRANEVADSIDKARGADDPYYINSAAYDSVQTDAHEPYNRLFNVELGPGGWENINRAHFANIARALDAHRGEGRRMVITYGAAHKEWFMRALLKRDDVTILPVAPFLDQIRRR